MQKKPEKLAATFSRPIISDLNLRRQVEEALSFEDVNLAEEEFIQPDELVELEVERR